MFGLVLKDILLIRRERTVVLMMGVSVISYALLSSSPALAVLIGVLPAYAMTGWSGAFDYKYRADSFLNSLPASRSAVVGARYLSALAVWAASMALACAGWGAARLVGIGPVSAPLGFAATTLGTGSVLLGVYLGSYYLFGYQGARWVSTIVFVLVGVVGGASGAFRETGPGLSGAVGEIVSDLTLGRAPISAYAALLCVGAATYAVSYLAARAKYRRAEF